MQRRLHRRSERSRRHASHRDPVGDVADDYCVRANDDVVADAHPPENLGAGADLNPMSQRGSPERVGVADVTQGHTVPDQTIVADDGGAVNDDAAVMFDAEAPADDGGRANRDSTGDFDELVKHDIDNGPRCTNDLVLDHESGMSEAVYHQCPEAQAKQALALSLEVFQQDVHARIVVWLWTLRSPACDITDYARDVEKSTKLQAVDVTQAHFT